MQSTASPGMPNIAVLDRTESSGDRNPSGPGGERKANRDGNGQNALEMIPWTIRLGTEEDRESIYRLRHVVYARELGQHSVNAEERLSDALDGFNHYIVVAQAQRILGFVSITAPGGPSYSIDKYLRRDQLPFQVDDRLYEVRLLTVAPNKRRQLLALALMYAVFRWVEAHGGTRIMAMGRREVMSMYRRVGLKPLGITIPAGRVTYELMDTTPPEVHTALGGIRKMLDRIQSEMVWQLGLEYDTPAPCYHGGAFFGAVGEEFNRLDRLESVISADVLDAWFPPAPKVIATLQEHLPRLLHTSPPTQSSGLVQTIARVRGVSTDCLLPGAGSSDLIYRALGYWLKPHSKVLILDPTYGEYSHLLERVIRCQVDRLTLRRQEGYRLDPARLVQHLAGDYDLVILVNPNSPTGRHVPRRDLEEALRKAPPATRVWVDETYVEYAGPDQSLEKFAANSPNVIVCKSLSKTYALSGARVAYLCARPHQLESLRAISPPWTVSLPGQVAAVQALQDPDYYAERYRQTHFLREQLAAGLKPFGWDIVPSVTNYLLCHLPADSPDAASLLAACRHHGLFLRDTASMSLTLGDRTIRIAVKDAQTNQRMIGILNQVLGNKLTPAS